MRQERLPTKSGEESSFVVKRIILC